ncbi:MAG: hypothetical protein HY905_23130 [Deltaproteobacteria bacterium]|nr:hypothetical protein [Deltaproteobacteria bacterium]
MKLFGKMILVGLLAATAGGCFESHPGLVDVPREAAPTPDDGGFDPDVPDDRGARDDTDGGSDVREDARDDADDGADPPDVDVPDTGSDACDPGLECPNDPIDGPIGRTCLDDTECDPGLRCVMETSEVFDGEIYASWRGGYCLTVGTGDAACDPDVAETCPVGSTCLCLGTDPAGQRYFGCLDACSAASSAGVPWTANCDCRDGYDCSLVGEFCYPGCSNDRECCEIWHDGEGGAEDAVRQPSEVRFLAPSECTDTCDPCTFRCDRNGCPGGDCRIGDPCEHDSDCPANGRCIAEHFAEAAIGGICVLDRCDLVGRECPAGSGCGNLGLDDRLESLNPPFERPSYTCVAACTVGSRPGDAGFACRDAGALGVADRGDQACVPAGDWFWYDATSSDGYCWPGNFPGGDGPPGHACSLDTDCTSPLGLGRCMHLLGADPGICTSLCNERLGREGTCGGGDSTTGTATGVCLSRVCLPACDAPAGALGANGCPERAQGCYALDLFDSYAWFLDGASEPAGLCLPACSDDAWCSRMFAIPTTCDRATGTCTF